MLLKLQFDLVGYYYFSYFFIISSFSCPFLYLIQFRIVSIDLLWRSKIKLIEISIEWKKCDLDKNEKRRNKVCGIHPKANYKVKNKFDSTFYKIIWKALTI